MERVVVLSDVHLGSDLNHVVESVRRSRGIDEDLVKLLGIRVCHVGGN